ncbi:MAG: Amidohydrolase, partial [Acidimicrobiales bacterium]|nr:Amidohydrolase [Acidimicrobiales bacterium]
LAAGLPAVVGPSGTGVVLDIGQGGPVVAIRGDIDALRMADRKGKEVPYRSTVEGVCHACGHDVHAVATLGAAIAVATTLAATGMPGTVRVVLQPAEEAVPGGASVLLASGALDGIQAAFGFHCDPSTLVGSIGISAGPITSAADQLEIRLKGPGGHTGRPHQTADLVHIAARVVVELPMSLGRLSDPRDGLNVTFGAIQAGDAANVIPTEARILGSLRAAGRGAWDAAPRHLPALLAAIVEPLGATWELDHHRGAPPIVNDPWAVEIVSRAGAAVVGPQAVGATQQSGGGEDFSWFGEVAPVGYLRLGVRRPGSDPVDLHAGTFDVDESAIALGARIMAGTAIEALLDLA